MPVSIPIDRASKLQIVYQEKSHVTSHPIVQPSGHPKGDRNAEIDANSGSLDVLGHPMSMVKLPMLSTARPEEENPDHGKWDTYVM